MDKCLPLTRPTIPSAASPATDLPPRPASRRTSRELYYQLRHIALQLPRVFSSSLQPRRTYILMKDQ